MNPEENNRLVHDTAMATTAAVLECFNLRPEEYKDAHDEVYPVVRAGLVAYLHFRHRELKRLGEDATIGELTHVASCSGRLACSARLSPSRSAVR